MIGKITFSGLIFITGTLAYGQKASVETVSLSLKTYGKENTSIEIRKNALKEAKKHADLSLTNETTANDPKMWLMRARTYLAIQMDTLGQGKKPFITDSNAIETAVNAMINCHKTDDKERYVKEVDALNAFVNITVQSRYIADVAFNNKDYNLAVKYYSLARKLIPYDKENMLKRQNISDSKLLFSLATTEELAEKYEDAKKHFQELIQIKYSDPWVYLDLFEIYLSVDKDTNSAIKTIDLGRKMFEDNMNMKRQQIFIYSASGKSDDLVKIMNENIELDPYNAGNFYLRGILYLEKGDLDKAETDLLKAIEFNEDLLEAREDIGKLYYRKGLDVAEKADKLGLKEVEKYDKMNEEVKAYFDKAIPHFERIYELTADEKLKNTAAQVLLAMYLKTEKLDKYKAMKAEVGR